jgi:hypothetical protein
MSSNALTEVATATLPFIVTLLLCLTVLSGGRPTTARQVRNSAGSEAGAQDPSAELKTSRQAVERDKKNPEAWLDYGEELLRAGDARAALRAFRESVKLYTKLYLKESAPGGTPGVRGAARLRAMAERLRHAPRAVERYLQSADGLTDFERAQLVAFGEHARMLNETDPRRSVFFAAEVETKSVITYRPEPSFTEEARQAGTRGAVKLRAVLASDGAARRVFVTQGLPHGMTEACVAAARRIKFESAMRDGRRVSQFVVIEYNFNIY